MFGFKREVKAVITKVTDGFIVMYPDGKISAAVEFVQAEMKIAKWFKGHGGTVGLTEVRI